MDIIVLFCDVLITRLYIFLKNSFFLGLLVLTAVLPASFQFSFKTQILFHFCVTSLNCLDTDMDHVRDGEIQGRSLVFLEVHCLCI